MALLGLGSAVDNPYISMCFFMPRWFAIFAAVTLTLIFVLDVALFLLQSVILKNKDKIIKVHEETIRMLQT